MEKPIYRLVNGLAVSELYCQASGTRNRREMIRREIASEYFIWG